MAVVRLPARKVIFNFATVPTPVWVPPSLTCSGNRRLFFPGVKRPKCEAHYWPPTNGPTTVYARLSPVCSSCATGRYPTRPGSDRHTSRSSYLYVRILNRGYEAAWTPPGCFAVHSVLTCLHTIAIVRKAGSAFHRNIFCLFLLLCFNSCVPSLLLSSLICFLFYLSLSHFPLLSFHFT